MKFVFFKSPVVATDVRAQAAVQNVVLAEGCGGMAMSCGAQVCVAGRWRWSQCVEVDKKKERKGLHYSLSEWPQPGGEKG